MFSQFSNNLPREQSYIPKPQNEKVRIIERKCSSESVDGNETIDVMCHRAGSPIIAERTHG